MKKLLILFLSIAFYSGLAQDNEATQLSYRDIVATHTLSPSNVANALTSIIKGKPNYMEASNTSGTNTYTATSTSSITSYTAGLGVTIHFVTGNTAAVTININSLGAKSVLTNSGVALASGDIPNDSYFDLVYNGTAFKIKGAISSGGGSGTVSDFTAGNLSPLFTTSVATSTTTPALTFSLTSQAQNAAFIGPASGSGAPTFRVLVAGDIPTLGYIPTSGTKALVGDLTVTGAGIRSVSFGDGAAANILDFNLNMDGNINAFANASEINTTGINRLVSTIQSSLVVGSRDIGVYSGGIQMNLGSDADGDIWFRNSSYVTRRAIGTAGQVLTVSGGLLPVWTTPNSAYWPLSGSATFSGDVSLDGARNILIGQSTPVNSWIITGNDVELASATQSFALSATGAKLNLGSDATGDFPYRNSSGFLVPRHIGSTGDVLTVSGGLPVWAPPASGGTVTSVTSANGDATVATTTTTPVITIVSAPKWSVSRTLSITGDLTYTSPSIDGSGDVTAAGTLATVNSNVGSFGSATQVPTFTVNGKGLITAVSNVTITPAASSITGAAALTKTDDTNVTVTLGGSPTTALLSATSLTLGWTGQLSLTRGGTNANLTASNGGIFYSTSSAGAILAGTATANKILLSGSSTAPSWSTSTIPTSSGTSGNLLTSDGTNWLSSAPTFWNLGGASTLSSANTITGTTTNTIKYIFNSLGASITTVTNGAGLWLANTTAAISGTQQTSPWMVFEGQGFGTTAGTSQSTKVAMGMVPVQGTTPGINFQLMGSINGGPFTNLFTITGSGPNASSYGFAAGASLSGPSSTVTLQAQNSATLGFQYLQGFTSVISNGVAWDFGQGFAPTSGTTTWKGVRFSGTINQTGGATGATTMIDIIPTLTSSGGIHTGIHYKPTETSISTHYFIVDESTTALNGFGLASPTATLHVLGSVKLDANVVLPTLGNKISIKEGSGGFMGQTALISGTKAVTISGVTTSTRAFPGFVSPGGTVSTTWQYKMVCTANTLTITAIDNTGATNTLDTSTLNYILYEPAP